MWVFLWRALPLSRVGWAALPLRPQLELDPGALYLCERYESLGENSLVQLKCNEQHGYAP